MKSFFILILALLLAGCNNKGGSAFGTLDSKVDGGTDEVIDPVVISFYTPEIDPVVLTNTSSQVFGVSVNGNVGEVTYDFIKDNGLTIQTGSSAFYNLTGASLLPGPHTLTIVAKNKTSQAEKTFNVRKNTPTRLISPMPAATGPVINCGTEYLDFSSLLDDVDMSDNYVATWYLDTIPVTNSTPFTSLPSVIRSFTQLRYEPDCTKAGTHTLQLKVNDGFETSEVSWSFTVVNPPPPPGTVQITSFTPTINPIVLTNNSNITFGVTVADGAGSVTYDFIQDTTSMLQSGGTSFYNLSGSTLTAGSHSIKIKADNGITTDEKFFSVRKNTPPSIMNYTPTLNGGSLNCSGGSQVLEAHIADLDLDAISVKWKLDNILVTTVTPFVTTSNADGVITLTYTPDCTKTGVHAFQLLLSDGYEEIAQTWSVTVNNPPPPLGAVQILSFTPTTNPVLMTKNSEVTFGVTVADGAGTVNYTYTLDGSTTLQTGATSFYTLPGLGLAAGSHSVKVVASNGTTQAEKVFNIRKNTPPSVSFYTPSLTGGSLNCAGGSQRLEANVADIDNDFVSVKWKIDNDLVNPTTNFITTSYAGGVAGLTYTPDCSKTGVHIFELVLSDGSEEYSQSWTVTVNNPPAPPGNVQIISFRPTANPAIVTNSTSLTFGVTLADGSGNVTYNFALDGATTLQAGSTSFYTLSGLGLAPGFHSVKTIATNGITSDEKVFNIRKNTPPGLSYYSPGLTGTSFNCSGGSQKIEANLTDVDSDSISVSWKMDDVTITPSTQFISTTNTPSYASLTFTPDCSAAGVHRFQLILNDGYEDFVQTWVVTVNNPPAPPGNVQIISFSPTSSNFVVTSATNTTFGVTVAEGSGTVSYDFIQDSLITLQTGSASFYPLSGSTLSAGTHALKIVAKNSVSQDIKIFNIRKNTPPSISAYSPSLNGNSFNCTGSSITLRATIGDYDGDGITTKWKIDDSLVNQYTDFVTTTRVSDEVQLVYTPDCTKVGTHNIQLVINDGYEDFVQTWAVTVNNPPATIGNVVITNFTPTAASTVMTGASSVTYAVSVQDGAGVVNYEFKLDDTTVLQNGIIPYLILDGSSLSEGQHTLRVKASNSVSYQEKSFNIRRNSLPYFTDSAPGPTGSSVNCGTGSITFNATVIDSDPGTTLSKAWLLDNNVVTHSLPIYDVTDNPNSGKLIYKPDCSATGVHNMSFRVYDGYEYSTLTWTFNVLNPAQETLGTLTPSGSTVVALSTETSKTFTAVAATGIPPYTFKWTIKRAGQPDVIKKTETGVTSSSLLLTSSSDLVFGDQTVEVKLTDSTTSNDPAMPAERTWTVYKNQKPTISLVSPSGIKNINTTSSQTLSALITDSEDTFTSSIVRGASACSPASLCGLSIIANPTRTGSFNATFLPSTSFIGDNTFTLNVTDSHGETASTQFIINANLFPTACNNLSSGQICTIAGMPGMGDELDISLANNLSKVRITPYTMSMHNAGLTKKNMFITDYVNHVVWYWNRNSTTVQLGPFSIPSNSVKIILGVPGYAQNMLYVASPNPALLYDTTFGNFTTTKLENFFLNGPTAITNNVSGSVTNVYIAEYNNNRMYRMQFNNSTSTVSIVPSASLGSCAPLDATVDTGANKLYVTCNSSQYLRILDLQTAATPYAFQATGQSASTVATSLIGSPYNDGAVNTAAYTTNPGSVVYDPTSGVTYFTETNTCRLRVLNPTGNSSTLNLFQGSANPISVAPGNITTITGGYNSVAAVWCNQSRLGYFSTTTTTQFGSLRGIVPYYLNGSLLGFFLSDNSYHRVIFVNQTAQTITIGNKSVPAYNAAIVFGLNNVAGSTNNNGATAGGKSSPLNSQLDIEVDNGTLFVSDYGNNRIRSLVIDNGSSLTTNGTVATALGYIPRYGYNESPTLQSELVQFYSPTYLKYDSFNNRLLINDYGNRRIRSLSLSTGVVDTIVGNGSVVNQTVQSSPLTAGMNTPYDIEILSNGGSEYPIYADSPYFIKALNIYGTNESIMGTEVEPGKLNNIAGTISPPGITNTTPSYNLYQWWANPIGDAATGNLFQYTGQPAVVVPINGPRGIGFDETTGNTYVSATSDHCIHKIDSSGIISVHTGLCTQANNQSGSFANTRFNTPGDIEMDPLNPGNYFVIDQIASATSILKYVNTLSGAGSSRTILGQPIPGNSVGSISLSIQANYATAIAVNDSQVCIANGNGNFYATSGVFCYTRSTGGISIYIGNRNNPTIGTTAFRGKPQKYNEDEGKAMGYYLNGSLIDEKNNPAQLSDPQGLAFDGEGNLYISEARGHTIRMVKKWY